MKPKILLQPESRKGIIANYKRMSLFKKVCKKLNYRPEDCMLVLDISNYIQISVYTGPEVPCYAAIFRENYDDSVLVIYDETLITGKEGVFSRPFKRVFNNLIMLELARDGINEDAVLKGNVALTSYTKIIYAASTYSIPSDMFTSDVFGGPNTLTDVIFTENANKAIKEIGIAAFKDCRALRRIVIPENCQKIGSFAFACCKELDCVILRNCVSIGDCAFWHCDALEAVILSTAIRDIGTSAFEDCCNLEDIGMLDKNGNELLDELYSLQTRQSSYKYADSVIIDDEAFKNCTKLVHMPAVLTHCAEIPESVCEGCSSMLNITIGSRTSLIKKNAFKDCSSVEFIKFEYHPNTTIYDIEDGAFALNNKNGTDAHIYSNIAKIEPEAFDDTVTLIIDDKTTLDVVKEASDDIKYIYNGAE